MSVFQKTFSLLLQSVLHNHWKKKVSTILCLEKRISQISSGSEFFLFYFERWDNSPYYETSFGSQTVKRQQHTRYATVSRKGRLLSTSRRSVHQEPFVTALKKWKYKMRTNFGKSFLPLHFRPNIDVAIRS